MGLGIKIKTVGENGSFEDVLRLSNAEVREIAHATRALLAEVMPNITEVPWVRQRIAGYGVGPRKMSEHFCYIAPQKTRVNLGFLYGAELPDPESLLEGNGQLLRHIKLYSLEDLARPAVKKLVQNASQHLPKLR